MPVTDSKYFRIVSFTPDAHAVASTHDQRSLLGACSAARQKVLESLDILTLYGRRPNTREIATYRIPFDCENTCLCIGNWTHLFMSPSLVMRLGDAKGMEFAKKIKHVAFLIPDGDICYSRTDAGTHYVPFLGDIPQVALLFHNTLHIAAITESSYKIRGLLGEESFLPLFSFQPFIQKTIVRGIPVRKTRSERRRLLRAALGSSLEGWHSRIRATLYQAHLLDPMSQIYEARTNDEPADDALRAIGLSWCVVRTLIRHTQAIRDNESD